MRLTEDGLETSEFDMTGNPVNMSIASDASSRDDSGSGLSGSGASRHDFIWSDDKFNTRRSSMMSRDRSQDSQSSETGSCQSDSSGSAFLNNSHPATQGYGLMSHSNKVVSPSHSHNLGYHNGDMEKSTNEDTLHSDPYPMSVSYDQSLMIHAIRKQKALAHYYELMENGAMDNNNYTHIKPCNDNRQKKQDYLQKSKSLDYEPGVPTQYYRNAKDVDPYIHTQTVVSPPKPPRLVRPTWRHPVDQSRDQEPPSHPFYVPMNPKQNGMDSQSAQNGLPHLNMTRSRDFTQDKEMSRELSPRTLAKVAFQTRALSLDFGSMKVPDFPCHRAALEESNSGSSTPVKDYPMSFGQNGLNKSWNGYPLSHQENSSNMSPNGKFALHSISESRARIQKSPQAARPRQTKPVERSLTTSSHRDSSSDGGTLKRSSSAPNQLDDWTEDEDDEEPIALDMGIDDDDYGFLSHPGFTHVHASKDNASHFSPPADVNKSGSSPTGMQKAKSPITSRRILPKRWRKSKTLSVSNKHVPIWKPEGGCIWSCKNGRQLTLSHVSLLTLTEIERVSLQKIAQAKLQTLDLGCHVPIPKDWNRNKRSKKSTFSSLRKRTASTSALESKGKDSNESCGVFGIPLGKCIANDLELKRRKSCLLQERHESLEIPTHTPRHTRKSSSSSTALSSESLSHSDNNGRGSSLLDALSLSTSSTFEAGMSSSDMEDSPLAAHIPQVPCVVKTCCKHIETYGLRVLGIFRIGSSKKRAKQLREEFEKNRDIKLNEEHNIHDVAALFKEYFRDLPDPLFTRDLYSAFVATRKIKGDDHRLHALTMLLSLLPTPNRDTLWALLGFLNVIVQHSTDLITETGEMLPGNMMDSTNLATLFGPNLLHKAKGGEYQVESLERAEEKKEIIAVIKELIDKQELLFKLQPSIQDELYRRVLEANPEALDFLLKKRAHNSPTGLDLGHETSTSSFLDDSEGSPMPHSPGYNSSENDHEYPRTFAEAMQLGSAHVSPGSSQLRIAPSEGPMVYQTSPSPAGTPRGHRPATRVRSDNTQYSDRTSDSSRNTSANNRLSVPDSSGWYRGNRSVSPSSPRISPSPKAMKAETPELRTRISKADSGDKPQQTKMDVGVSLQVRRSVGVPHGPGPGGYKSKYRNTLTVPALCSRSKSTESCSSIGSSSGYQAGSSRSGTNSPMSPDSGFKKWYLDTPPDSPKDGSDPSPFNRTSSTHRPLGFNVPRQSSLSSSSSLSPVKTGSSPHSASDSCGHITPGHPAYGHSTYAYPISGKSSSGHQTSGHPASHTSASTHDIVSQSPPSSNWQKEHWSHWEKITKQQSVEQKEQETLV